MKTLFFILFLCLYSFAYSQQEYVATINGTAVDVKIDTTYVLHINGEDVTFSLSEKDTVTYNDDLFSFQYSKDYKVSKLTLDEGIEQIMIMTAEGSGILIQKYSTINPEMITELMINEVALKNLTERSEMKRTNYKRKLVSGQKLTVDKIEIRSNGEKTFYEFASVGEESKGIFIVTIISMSEYSSQGKKIIELMWNSLSYN